jgi:aryl-alcohol dehydrogenase-like predicted oxidoreductase
MEYRTLGRSGVQVGVLALGTMMFGRGGNRDRDECVRMVHRALDAGINLFDTADGYGLGDSEEILGRAVADRRDRALVATKCFFPHDADVNRRGGSRRWIVRACDESLRRLGLDYIDLYQLHRLDPTTDVEESLGAMTDLVRAGKVRMVGTSAITAHELVELQWAVERTRCVRPVSEQPMYSIFTRAVERAVLPACQRYGVGTIVYGPLNGGWLAGKYARAAPPEKGTRAARGFYSKQWWDFERAEIQRKLDLVDALTALAHRAGFSLAHLALAFTLAHPGVTAAIIGPRTLAQLDDLIAGAHVRLGDDVLDEIDRLVPPATDVDPANEVSVDPALDARARRRKETSGPARVAP